MHLIQLQVALHEQLGLGEHTVEEGLDGDLGAKDGHAHGLEDVALTEEFGLTPKLLNELRGEVELTSGEALAPAKSETQTREATAEETKDELRILLPEGEDATVGHPDIEEELARSLELLNDLVKGNAEDGHEEIVTRMAPTALHHGRTLIVELGGLSVAPMDVGGQLRVRLEDGKEHGMA